MNGDTPAAAILAAQAPRVPRWFGLGWLACLALPFLFSVPRLPHMRAEVRAYWDAHWREAVQRKIDHPLLDMATLYPPDSNEAKRSFRLTVPLLAKLSGIGYPATVILRFGAWLALPALLLGLARRAGLEPAAATAVALAIMGTTTGTCVWRDDCLWFDNVAHTWIALAMLAQVRWLIAGAVVMAAFTDERVFLVLPLVGWWHWVTAPATERLGAIRAVAVGLTLALTLRVGLVFGAGLQLPLVKVGTAKILERNLSFAWLAWWAAWEGGWLLVAASVRAAWQTHRLAALAFAATCATPLSGALLVEDFGRSCSYAFPAVLVAAALVQRTAGARVRWLCCATAIASLVVPNALVSGFLQIETPAPWWRTELVFWP